MHKLFSEFQLKNPLLKESSLIIHEKKKIHQLQAF